MMVIVNYRSETKLKSSVFINKMFFLIIISFFISTIGTGQTKNDSNNRKVDSISEKIINKPSLNDSIDKFQPIDGYSNDLESSEKTKKIPARAALYSAILPGLGQTYNGNYWKVPIIYSLFAGMYFLYEENNYKYNEFKQAYKNSLNGVPVDPKFEKYDQSTLLQRKDYYKRNRDFNIIIGGLIYLLNVLDANVDAHLMDYDISPDLSLNVKPEINSFLVNQNYSNKPGFGLKFVLSLH